MPRKSKQPVKPYKPYVPSVFKLYLDLEEYPLTGDDIAQALRTVANAMATLYGPDKVDTFHTQNIRQDRGNDTPDVIGSFAVKDNDGNSFGMDRFFHPVTDERIIVK